jgi:hypothetical protein
MDIDEIGRRLTALEERVVRLEGWQTVGPVALVGTHPAIDRRNAAHQQIYDKDFDGAASTLNLPIAKGESAESHQRRLHAEVYGAKAADAERPRAKGDDKTKPGADRGDPDTRREPSPREGLGPGSADPMMERPQAIGSETVHEERVRTSVIDPLPAAQPLYPAAPVVEAKV